jgi:hypothetical protein
MTRNVLFLLVRPGESAASFHFPSIFAAPVCVYFSGIKGETPT